LSEAIPIALLIVGLMVSPADQSIFPRGSGVPCSFLGVNFWPKAANKKPRNAGLFAVR